MDHRLILIYRKFLALLPRYTVLATCEALCMHLYCLSSFFRMGRGFIVEDVVGGYLSRLCEQSTSPITGLLIGQVQYKCTFYWHFIVLLP